MNTFNFLLSHIIFDIWSFQWLQLLYICFYSSLLLLFLTYSGLFPQVHRNSLNYEFIWLGTSSVGFGEMLFKVHTFRGIWFGFYLPLRDHTKQGHLTLKNTQLRMFWHQEDSVNSRHDPAWVWACARGLSEEAIFFISLRHPGTKLKQVHIYIIVEAHPFLAYPQSILFCICVRTLLWLPNLLGALGFVSSFVHMWSIKTQAIDVLQSVDTPGQCQVWHFV